MSAHDTNRPHLDELHNFELRLITAGDVFEEDFYLRILVGDRYLGFSYAEHLGNSFTATFTARPANKSGEKSGIEGEPAHGSDEYADALNKHHTNIIIVGSHVVMREAMLVLFVCLTRTKARGRTRRSI